MVVDAVFRVFRWTFTKLFGTRIAAAMWHIPGSRRLYRLLMGRLAPSTVVVAGHTMFLDPVDSLLLSINGEYEQFESSLFEACLRPGDLVVDVGAHIGLYTLRAARAVQPSGRVVSFEPMAANAAILRRNVEQNGYTNVEIVQAALSDHRGRGHLQLCEDNTGDNSLGQPTSASRGFEEVATTTLDAHLGNIELDMAIVKMDIQGGEPDALSGARGILDRTPEAIVFTEVSPAHLGGHEGAEEYVRSLATMGFEFFTVDENSASLDPLQASGVAAASLRAGHDGHLNLVCVRGTETRARVKDALLRVTPEVKDET